MKNISNILLFIVLIFALWSRVDYEVKFNDLYADKIYQIYAAKGIDKGYGCNILTTDVSDFSKLNINRLKGYPPGYSYIIASLTPMVSYINVSIIVDSFAIILLIMSILLLLKLLNISQKNIVFIILFYAVSQTPFGYLTSTDLLVTAFFIFHSFLLFYFISKNIYKTYSFISLGITLYIPLFFKYSALPILAITPALLLLLYFINKNRILLKGSIIVFFTSIILFVIQKILLPDYPKDKIFSRGFFPNQLLQFDSFAFKSFYSIDSYINIIRQHYEILGSVILLICSLFSFAIILFVVYKAFSLIKKQDLSLLSIFNYYTAISILFISGFLIVLSLIIPGETWKIPAWTYVEETRYYGIVMLLIQLFFFTLKNKHKLIYLGLIVSIFINFLLFSKQFYNLYIDKNMKYTFEWNYKEEMNIKYLIDKVDNNNTTIMYSTYSEIECVTMADLTKVDNIITFDNLYDSKFYSSTPITIILKCTTYDFNRVVNKFNINNKNYRKISDLDKESLFVITLKNTNYE